MEIFTYVKSGFLTHTDSLGHKETIGSDAIQYQSAGTGIEHSEWNENRKEKLHLVQTWVIPDRQGHTPRYGTHTFEKKKSIDNILQLIDPDESREDTLSLRQDFRFFTSILSEYHKTVRFEGHTGRQLYLLVLEDQKKISLQVETQKGSNDTKDTSKQLRTTLMGGDGLFIVPESAERAIGALEMRNLGEDPVEFVIYEVAFGNNERMLEHAGFSGNMVAPMKEIANKAEGVGLHPSSAKLRRSGMLRSGRIFGRKSMGIFSLGFMGLMLFMGHRD